MTTGIIPLYSVAEWSDTMRLGPSMIQLSMPILLMLIMLITSITASKVRQATESTSVKLMSGT